MRVLNSNELNYLITLLLCQSQKGYKYEIYIYKIIIIIIRGFALNNNFTFFSRISTRQWSSVVPLQALLLVSARRLRDPRRNPVAFPLAPRFMQFPRASTTSNSLLSLLDLDTSLEASITARTLGSISLTHTPNRFL